LKIANTTEEALFDITYAVYVLKPHNKRASESSEPIKPFTYPSINIFTPIGYNLHQHKEEILSQND
jgi:hypothetical protein